MIHIFNSDDLKKNSQYINQISDLYNSCFPDINEREEFENILNRVMGIREKYDPNTILLFYPKDEKVVAGLIADWYKHSKSIHITYIFVSPYFRNKGIAKHILKNEIPKIIKQIFDLYKIEIKGVFLEANNPKDTIIDSINTSIRLEIFKKIGIKWIDIPYIQPALDSNREKVNNLFLLVLPISESQSSKIKKDIVIQFLCDLYKSLQIEDPFEKPDFLKMINHLSKNMDVKLKEIQVE
jgi:predicted GNAT family acetyltransferase